MYSTLVESLKRLYTAEKVTLEKLNDFKTRERISEKEFDYITSHYDNNAR